MDTFLAIVSRREVREYAGRPLPDETARRRAVELIRGSKRPLIVAGGGVIYSEATDALRALCDDTGIPVAETQAGKGSLPYDHPQAVGAIGATGTSAANALAAEADVVIGVGTRYGDFTSASKTVFADAGVRFVNLNVASVDAHKLSAVVAQGDARRGLDQLTDALSGWSAPAACCRPPPTGWGWAARARRVSEQAPPRESGRRAF